MSSNPYLTVRQLPISFVAKRWAEEGTLKIDEQVILSELKLSFANMGPGRDWRKDGLLPLKDLPSAKDLPSDEEYIDRDKLEEFCYKQGWPKPRFWFPEDAPKTRGKGRPTNRELGIAEFLRLRDEEGRTWGSKIEAAREIEAWLKLQPDLEAEPAKDETISGWLTAHWHD